MAAGVDAKHKPQTHILVVEDNEGLSKPWGLF